MLVSAETVAFFEEYINVWLILAVATCGLFANSIQLFAYSRMRSYHGSVAIPIMAVCFWNFTRCLSALLHRVCGPIGLVSEHLGAIWRNASGAYLDGFVTIAGHESWALVAYLSITRCLYVAIPVKARSTLSPRFTLVMVVSISAFVFAVCTVTFFSDVVKPECGSEFNLTLPRYERSEFCLSHSEVINEYYLSLCVTIPSVTVCVVSTSSILTVYFVKRSANSAVTPDRRKANSPPKLSQREKGVTKFLLVTFIFLSFYLLPPILFCAAQLAEPELAFLGTYNDMYLLTSRILMAFDLTNTFAIFAICLKMRPEFRAFFKCFK